MRKVIRANTKPAHDPDPPSLPAILTISEAAQYLRIGRNQCYEAARQGLLPTIRLGPRTLRVPRIALERLQSAETDEPT